VERSADPTGVLAARGPVDRSRVHAQELSAGPVTYTRFQYCCTRMQRATLSAPNQTMPVTQYHRTRLHREQTTQSAECEV